MPISSRFASIAQQLLPVVDWLPSYRRDWLVPDVLAGLAVWAVMVPEGMAYAGIVGVPQSHQYSLRILDGQQLVGAPPSPHHKMECPNPLSPASRSGLCRATSCAV
jgi:hypothetical protein